MHLLTQQFDDRAPEEGKKRWMSSDMHCKFPLTCPCFKAILPCSFYTKSHLIAPPPFSQWNSLVLCVNRFHFKPTKPSKFRDIIVQFVNLSLESFQWGIGKIFNSNLAPFFLNVFIAKSKQTNNSTVLICEVIASDLWFWGLSMYYRIFLVSCVS